MLKGLLPLIKKIRKSLPLKDKKEKTKKEKELLQERNLSPNLLIPIETKSLIMKAIPKIAKTAKTLATVTLVIYSVFFIADLFLQILLNDLVRERDSLLEQNSQYVHIENRVKEISKVTKLYKDTKLQNQDVSDSLEWISQVLEPKVEVKEFSFDRDDLLYELEASSPRATTFALLITEVLENENVESITIEEVNYISVNREYEAKLAIEIR